LKLENVKLSSKIGEMSKEDRERMVKGDKDQGDKLFNAKRK
jgi:hypothetical protein